jgi:hypothetical protein
MENRGWWDGRFGQCDDLGVEKHAWWGFCKTRQEKVFVMEAVRTCVRERSRRQRSVDHCSKARRALNQNVTRRYAFASRPCPLCPPRLEANGTSWASVASLLAQFQTHRYLMLRQVSRLTGLDSHIVARLGSSQVH